MNFLNSTKVFKNNLLKKENIFFLILILLIFFLDRYSKNFILNNFNETKFYINNYFNLDLTWNTGIGFGLLSTEMNIIYNLTTIFIGVVILVLLLISIKSDIYDKFLFSLITGGAIGNFYDRVTYKAVPDFIDVHYNNFHWFTFNVADVFITLGITFFISRSLFVKN